jgi:hypothetical protein
MIYKWKTEFPANGVDAQVAGERLEKLRKKNGLTPKTVVDDARPKESPLHACFEWNDSVAAEKYREDQARVIMRNITVQVEDNAGANREVRAFVNVAIDEGREYTSISNAMSDADLRKQVLDSALHEIDGWRKKYRDLQELAEVLSAADRVVEKLGSKVSVVTRNSSRAS